MNWDKIEGNWKQLKGEIRERWGRLTNDDIDIIQGNREKLIGKLQERYGIRRDEAEREINAYLEEERVTHGKY